MLLNDPEESRINPPTLVRSGPIRPDRRIMSRFAAVHRIAPSDILAGQVSWPVRLVASRLAGCAWWNAPENDRRRSPNHQILGWWS